MKIKQNKKKPTNLKYKIFLLFLCFHVVEMYFFKLFTKVLQASNLENAFERVNAPVF